MGCRTATTRRPWSRSFRQTRRVVWLFPAPVRTAQTDTTGLVERIEVSLKPSRAKSEPAAITCDALCMTCSCDTSE